MTYIPGSSEPRREPLGPPAYQPPITPTQFQPSPWPTVGPPPAPPKKRHTGLIIGLSIAAAVVLVGAALLTLALLGKSPVSIPGVPSTMTVHGRMVIASDCTSIGYGDISDGTEVTLTDQDNKVLAVGHLDGGGCSYQFELDQVPTGEKFYGITVSHRGTVHFTEAEMRAGPVLSLG